MANNIEAILKERGEKRKARNADSGVSLMELLEYADYETDTDAQVDEFARQAIERIKLVRDYLREIREGNGDWSGDAIKAIDIFFRTNGIEETTK